MDADSTFAPGLYCLVGGQMIVPIKTLHLAAAVHLLPIQFRAYRRQLGN